MISFVQNFICTKEARLKVLNDNLPKIGNVFKDTPFYINYNTKVNYDKVYKLYKDNISNLTFNNDLDENWGKVTLDLVKKVKTPYVITHCEDYEYDITDTEWNELMEEIVERDISYLPIGRLWKYTREQYLNGYDEGKNLWLYSANKSPGSSLSVDAIYKTDMLIEKLEELVKYYPEGRRFPISLPHHFEDIFHEPNGVTMWGSKIKCAIPKREIIKHNCNDTETMLNK